MTTKTYDKTPSPKCLTLLLLLLMAGATGALAQTDYSGTYYIASGAKSENNGSDYTYDSNDPANNFYLCPIKATNWIYYQSSSPYYTTTSNGQPFLTTFKCRSGATDPTTGNPYDEREAKWTFIKHPSRDCYYIRRNIDGKYLTLNVKLGNSAGTNRLRLHVETPGSLDDNHLFAVAIQSTYLVISPVNATADSKTWYLNVHQGNFNALTAQQAAAKNEGPTGYKNIGGTIGIYSDITDQNAPWYLEDLIPSPVIDQQNNNTIAITYPGSETVTLYYTTDGSKPDPTNADGDNPTKTYSGTFAATEGATVKAIAVKTKGVDEALDTYSQVATLNVDVLLGTGHPYLVQSQENTNYYMIPVTDTDNAGGYTKTHTTTLGQPSMMWYFLNAGNVGGVQYYYLVNKSTGQYVYYHTSGSDFLISVNSGETFDADADKDPYSFSINEAVGGGYTICPKNNSGRCITKNSNNKHNGYIKANTSKTDAIGRWSFISVSDQKMPATTPPVMTSTANAAKYYTLENEKLTGNYMSPATYVTTAASVTDSEKWYFLQAGTDDWLTYYHIVNAVSGEYLYLNNTDNNAVSTKSLNNDVAEAAKYQFVLAPSATGAFYIIPKSQAIQNTRLFTSLYYDGSNPLKTSARRFWSDDPSKPNGEDAYIKWNIAEADLDACQDPAFSESGGNIILSCPTFGAEIHYTIDGSTPTASTPTVYTNETSLSASSQYLVKAMAVFKNDPLDSSKDVSSSDIMLFNKPDVTLSQDTYPYDRSAHEPTVSKVSITISATEYEAPTSPTVSYVIDSYENNTNAGTATVNLVDNIDDDNIFFSNFSKDFTISKVSLTITPNDGQSKEYGDSDPVLTYTSSGLVAGDELVGFLSRAVGENVGTYPISQGTLNNANNTNYDISFTTGKTFAITAKSLGDGSTPAPNITCDVTETSGTYSIVVKQGGSNLTLGTDYTKDGELDGAKYYQVTVNGMGNYKDGFTVKLAKIQLSKRTGSVAPGGAALFVSDEHDGDFVVPDNMTAYIVTGISGNTLITEQLDNIPDHVPVLLVSTIDANSFLVQPEASATPPSSTNLLVEAAGDNAARTFGTAQIYLLYKGEFVLNAAGTVPAGKIYLPRSSSAPAPVKLYIDWDFVDGIDLEKEELRVENEEYYTLDGIKLGSKPTRKGLYITNGRKVAIK